MARLSDATLKKIEKLYDEGHSMAEIARITGLHYTTIQRNRPAVRTQASLSREAQRALSDFGYFRARYFGRVTTPWQEKAGHKIVELLETDVDEYLVVNVPPGGGKSTLLTDTCTWALVRDRGTRILYGSANQAVASDYTRRIMNDLTRTDPVRVSAKDQKHGLAIDGISTLTTDFGAFKPTNGDRWTKEKFVVRQDDDRTAQEKEASVAAFGMDSTFLGGRYDLNVWDDLVTKKTMLTEEAREKLIDFWDTYAETRVEPGGLIALVGQRLAGDDLYRYALDLLTTDQFDEDFIDLEDHIGGDPDAEIPKKYHHVVYPAHDESLCHGPSISRRGKDIPNPDHALTAKPWPHGCLLDPKRLSWRKLAMIKANKSERYDTVYQQKDVDAANSLVKQLWIDGGTVDGVSYPGCKDRDRAMWQIPKMTGDVTAYVTIDPSPTKNWSVQFWLYHHSSEMRFLIGHYRGPMQMPDLLDFNQLTLKDEGLLEDWWQHASNLGYPFRTVLLEENAAQKFMLQSNSVKGWAARRGVSVVGHKTHTFNKADPDYGISILGPLYERGLIRLPWSGHEALKFSGHLISEVTKYPNGAYTDCVMSQWFGEHNLAKIKRPSAKVYRMRPDDYLSKKARRGLSA